MVHNRNHVRLVAELATQLKPIFDKSPQAIYLYLDDEHKSCNKKFADLVGYKSVGEWVKNQYPVSDVVERNQQMVVNAYMHCSRKLHSQSISAFFKTKKDKEVEVDIVMVPLTYKKEVFVLHFISPK